MIMPAAHALMQAAEDIPSALSGLTTEQLWAKPGGAASVGYHVRHITGSIDRLLTYARGEMLRDAQVAALETEGQRDEGGATQFARAAVEAIACAIEVMRSTPPALYLEPREVGRRRLPTTVIGLLVHIAEHTQRHTGQIVTTAKVARSIA